MDRVLHTTHWQGPAAAISHADTDAVYACKCDADFSGFDQSAELPPDENTSPGTRLRHFNSNDNHFPNCRVPKPLCITGRDLSEVCTVQVRQIYQDVTAWTLPPYSVLYVYDSLFFLLLEISISDVDIID
jgi:hypothetical protein